VIDSGITPEELAYRKAVRIARGYERPQPEPRDVSPMTPQESATIGFEQGANVRIPNGLPVNPNQPTLFDTPKSFGPPIEFIKLPEGPSVDLEDRARALEPFMKSDGVLSAYNRVGHAEESYAKNPADSVKMDRVHHALRAKADNLMEEAQPQVDVLTAEEYYTRWGHSPKEIDAQRNDMIKDLREYGANTNSAERQVLLDKVKATAAMAASIKSRR